MAQENTILIVDDEPDIIEILRYNLEKEGYKTYSATNGLDAVAKAESILPDLILLDVMLPDMDGIQTCETIRSKPELRDTLIAFLTARSEDYSEIAGFQAGADDYITKPIRPKVLISRIQSLLKRTRQQVDTNIISYNEIVLNKEKMLVEMDGVSLTLPNKEFRLLELLISKPERVFTRKEIYSLIWGSDIIVGDRTIDVHIRKLREKLQERYIYTIKGVGYVFTR
ncbi:MAG: response regulator transcription factor [Bacteroidales bacterium]|nr:response regulator transcription factor [Bacteroidales bacterium]MBR4115894.1 response regulator transcription factor [Bacteroidales bacterium]MBR6266432.1 response regulator transcription factor [Bacteroidales bacterium]